MAETRTLIPLLNYVMDEVIELVGAERGYIVLLGPDGALDFRIRRGEDGKALEQAEDQISRSILRQVIDSGQPLVVRNAMDDHRFGHAESVVILRLRSVMCVPLIARGETMGAICVENRSIRARFSDDDAPPLVLLANQAAVAIENAALNEELEARVVARTEALQESEARYRSLTDDVIDTSIAGIFILDKDMRVVWLNQALERFFGLHRDEVIGQDKRHLIRERIADIFDDPKGFERKVVATYDDNTYVLNLCTKTEMVTVAPPQVWRSPV